MIDPKNQKIYIKGKLVDFDKLSFKIQNKLLTSWKLKPIEHDNTNKQSSKQSEQREQKPRSSRKGSSRSKSKS